MQELNAWLKSSRRDAVMARAEGVQITEEVMDKVRKLLHKANGHTIAVVTGGMMTPAITAKINKLPIPQTCPYCLENQVRSVHHVLWECSKFQHLRTHPVPDSQIIARIGWGSRVAAPAVIEQMSRIREAEAKMREKGRHNAGSAEGGRPGPPATEVPMSAEE